MAHINFIEPKKKLIPALGWNLFYMGVSYALLFAILSGVHSWEKKRHKRVADELFQLETKLEEIKKTQPESISTETASEDSSLIRLLDGYVDWTHIIRSLEKIKLSNIWLASLKGDTLKKEVTISGASNSLRSIVVFKERLISDGLFTEVRLDSTTDKAKDKEVAMFEFSLICTFKE